MFPKKLKGNLVTLNELSESFFEEYYTIFSPRIREILHIPPATFHETKVFLQERLEQHKKGKIVFYCIFDNKDKKLIGGIEIRDKNHPYGQLGNWINEQYWGGGRYQEVLDLVMKAYFKDNDEIHALVDTDNTRSYKALIKYGFKDARVYVNKDGIKLHKLVLKRKK